MHRWEPHCVVADPLFWRHVAGPQSVPSGCGGTGKFGAAPVEQKHGSMSEQSNASGE
jgi:hypothetical protein